MIQNFDSGAIYTPGIIGRIATLLAPYPELVRGFSIFSSPSCRIEYDADEDTGELVANACHGRQRTEIESVDAGAAKSMNVRADCLSNNRATVLSPTLPVDSPPPVRKTNRVGPKPGYRYALRQHQK